MNCAQKINAVRTFRGWKIRFGRRQPSLNGKMDEERFWLSAGDKARHVGRNLVVIGGDRFVVTMV